MMFRQTLDLQAEVFTNVCVSVCVPTGVYAICGLLRCRKEPREGRKRGRPGLGGCVWGISHVGLFVPFVRP